MIYASEHYSTTMLEKLVRSSGELPPNQHFIEITIPNGVTYEMLNPAHLPGWDDMSREASRGYGDAWQTSRRSLLPCAKCGRAHGTQCADQSRARRVPAHHQQPAPTGMVGPPPVRHGGLARSAANPGASSGACAHSPSQCVLDGDCFAPLAMTGKSARWKFVSFARLAWAAFAFVPLSLCGEFFARKPSPRAPDQRRRDGVVPHHTDHRTDRRPQWSTGCGSHTAHWRCRYWRPHRSRRPIGTPPTLAKAVARGGADRGR